MNIATWNVNSIRTRLDRVTDWIGRNSPDVLCLQELKVSDDLFPEETFENLGYKCVVHGQKTYNGVAILAKSEPKEIEKGLKDSGLDTQARLVSVIVDDIRVFSAYFPNGSEVGSEKYEYKLKWISRLKAFLAENYSPDERILICGDTNVARDEKDVENPDKWRESVLFHESARDAFEDLLDWGLVDVFRERHEIGGMYSWWDYRRLSFPKNDGLRLDYILATKPIAGKCSRAQIDRNERKGEKPSDHAPVLAEFDL